MKHEDIVLDFEDGKTYVLKIQEHDTEIDTEDLLRIDISNLFAEIVTFPVIMNRVGVLKNQMEEFVSRTKLDLEVFEAQLIEKKRSELSAKTDKRVTDTEITSAVKLDHDYSIKKKNYFRVQKNLAYLDSLYWACKSKDDKLNKLSEKLRPEEFEKEIIEESINKVLIKQTKRVIR